jgi:hypothetical protein
MDYQERRGKEGRRSYPLRGQSHFLSALVWEGEDGDGEEGELNGLRGAKTICSRIGGAASGVSIRAELSRTSVQLTELSGGL